MWCNYTQAIVSAPVWPATMPVGFCITFYECSVLPHQLTHFVRTFDDLVLKTIYTPLLNDSHLHPTFFYPLTLFVWCVVQIYIFVQLCNAFYDNARMQLLLLVHCKSVRSSSVSTARTNELLPCKELCISISVTLYSFIQCDVDLVSEARTQKTKFTTWITWLICAGKFVGKVLKTRVFL